MTEQQGAQQGAATRQGGKDKPLDFAAWLAQYRRGSLAAELSDKMADLLLAVEETGKKGSISLTITVDPKSNDGIVEVSNAVAVKKPQLPRPAGHYWLDGDGGLADSPKDQTALEFGGAR
ncbi:hypothetical protein [Pseudonocardia sp. NPDC049635]|uniref:hypothetical protein n=1 Tax=Pseudonocardia sp. NPDC049635 TaxID=3155506 RepID=UPI0033CCB894